jgi:hypothetical protein
MLFLMAMEPLHLLFKKVIYAELLSQLNVVYDACRVSLYIDGATLFIKRSKNELQVCDYVIQIFAQATGLCTNLNKTHYFPIRCEGVNMDFLEATERNVASFPCLYLGLPFSTKRPSHASLQPLVQKVGSRLPGWKKDLLSYPERELLIKICLDCYPDPLSNSL